MTAFDGLESDIKLSKTDDGKILIDLIAHQMMTNEDYPDKMNINIAAARSFIKDPSFQHQQKCHDLLQRIIDNSIKDLKVNDSSYQTGLKERGAQQLEALLQQ